MSHPMSHYWEIEDLIPNTSLQRGHDSQLKACSVKIPSHVYRTEQRMYKDIQFMSL